jgi:hypothetical protein
VYNVVKGTCFTSEWTVGGPDLPTVHLEINQLPFATLYTWLPDDGLQMGLKHVEGW